MAKRTTRSTSSNPSKRPLGKHVSETFENPAATIVDQATDRGVPSTRSDSMGSEPSEADIRMRAYRRYLERGGGDGQDFNDWLEAERELKQR
jgi:hypothetical protein